MGQAQRQTATYLSLDCFSLCSALFSLALSGGENTLRTNKRGVKGQRVKVKVIVV